MKQTKKTTILNAEYIKKNCNLAYLGAMSGRIPIVKRRAHVDKHMPRS